MIKKQTLWCLLLLLISKAYAFDVKVKVLLEGPLQGATMTTHLVNELKKNYANVPNDAVDLVSVELRTQLQGNAIETKKAFLLKDGSVVDYATLNPILHFNATGNSYYVVVKHRNHLPFASKNLVTNQATCDLTIAQNVFGEPKIVQGKAVMIAGNVHNEAGDMYEINASDFFKVSQANDNHLVGYIPEDANLDGVVNEKDLQIVKSNAEKLYFSQIQ